MREGTHTNNNNVDIMSRGMQAMDVAEVVGTIIKIVYLVKLITFIFFIDLATFNSLTIK